MILSIEVEVIDKLSFIHSFSHSYIHFNVVN